MVISLDIISVYVLTIGLSIGLTIILYVALGVCCSVIELHINKTLEKKLNGIKEKKRNVVAPTKYSYGDGVLGRSFKNVSVPF